MTWNCVKVKWGKFGDQLCRDTRPRNECKELERDFAPVGTIESPSADNTAKETKQLLGQGLGESISLLLGGLNIGDNDCDGL